MIRAGGGYTAGPGVQFVHLRKPWARASAVADSPPLSTSSGGATGYILIYVLGVVRHPHLGCSSHQARSPSIPQPEPAHAVCRGTPCGVAPLREGAW